MAQGLKIGTLLDHGKYRVEKVLGQGGFGITYLVTDLGLAKLRAVKEFFPRDYCDRDESSSQVSLGTSHTAELVGKLKRKFIKEARNIANLDLHQGIVRIHSVFEDNNTAYYVMDYIEGDSLSNIVKQYGPVPPEKAVKYISEIGEALKYVHSHRINHLDIKPANLMVRKKDDQAILIDFGLSKQYDSEGVQTSTSPTGISHGFAPLEQYRDGGTREFSPQTDIYSLAASLYYLITGTIPPHASDLNENASLLFFSPYTPQFIQQAIRKGLAPKRLDRPATVKEFLKLLNPVNYNSGNNQLQTIDPNSLGDTQSTVEIPGHPIIPRRMDGSPRTNGNQITGGQRPQGSNPSSFGNKIPPTPKPHSGGKSGGRKRNNPKAFYRKHKRAIGYIAFIVGILLVSAFVIFMIITVNTSKGNPETSSNIMPLTATNAHRTENFYYDTPLGKCFYSGEVDENGVPNGQGTATWQTGVAHSYDGQWVHGVMEGQATYVFKNGDTFVGTFKNGKFDNGKYTFKDDGSSFEGSFRDEKPDIGVWRDKNGNVMEL